MKWTTCRETVRLETPSRDMARFITAIASQDILVDELTHTVTVWRCLEVIRVPAFPVVLPPFFIATFWSREASEEHIQLRIQVHAPDGQVCYQKITGLESFEKALRFRFFIRIADLKCTVPGEYHFDIAMRHRAKGRWKTVFQFPIAVLEIDRHSSRSG